MSPVLAEGWIGDWDGVFYVFLVIVVVVAILMVILAATVVATIIGAVSEIVKVHRNKKRRGDADYEE